MVKFDCPKYKFLETTSKHEIKFKAIVEIFFFRRNYEFYPINEKKFWILFYQKGDLVFLIERSKSKNMHNTGEGRYKLQEGGVYYFWNKNQLKLKKRITSFLWLFFDWVVLLTCKTFKITELSFDRSMFKDNFSFLVPNLKFNLVALVRYIGRNQIKVTLKWCPEIFFIIASPVKAFTNRF